MTASTIAAVLTVLVTTRAGISIGVNDMVVPEEKPEILAVAEAEVKEIQEQYTSGLITNGERYNKVVDIWSRTNEEVAKEMMNKLGGAFTDHDEQVARTLAAQCAVTVQRAQLVQSLLLKEQSLLVTYLKKRKLKSQPKLPLKALKPLKPLLLKTKNNFLANILCG